MENGNGYPTCCPGDLVLSANKEPHLAVVVVVVIVAVMQGWVRGCEGAQGTPGGTETDRQSQTDIEANGKPKIFKQPHINVEHISARKCIKDNGCTHRYIAKRSTTTGQQEEEEEAMDVGYPDKYAGGPPGGFFKSSAKHPRICTDSMRIRLG